MYIVISVNHTCIQHNCNRIYITNYLLLSVFVLLLLLRGGAVVLGAVALVAVAASISALNLQ